MQPAQFQTTTHSCGGSGATYNLRIGRLGSPGRSSFLPGHAHADSEFLFCKIRMLRVIPGVYGLGAARVDIDTDIDTDIDVGAWIEI